MSNDVACEPHVPQVGPIVTAWAILGAHSNITPTTLATPNKRLIRPSPSTPKPYKLCRLAFSNRNATVVGSANPSKSFTYGFYAPPEVASAQDFSRYLSYVL